MKAMARGHLLFSEVSSKSRYGKFESADKRRATAGDRGWEVSAEVVEIMQIWLELRLEIVSEPNCFEFENIFVAFSAVEGKASSWPSPLAADD